jgi:hypothetical protein
MSQWQRQKHTNKRIAVSWRSTAVTSYESVAAAEAHKQEDSSKLEEYSNYEL